MSTVAGSLSTTTNVAREERLLELVAKVRQSAEEPDWEALRELTDLLPEEDGIPLETSWHRAAINLLIDVLTHHWRERDDFFVGGNMFVYYSLDRLLKQEFRGPDFFVVKGVDRHKDRRKWVTWDEGGKYPDLIVELLSESTMHVDRTTKKDLYEQVFHTPEYFVYDPELSQLDGWQLANCGYEPLEPNEQGWLWSGQLELWVGSWVGPYLDFVEEKWPRFYDKNGVLIPRESEAEKAIADHERNRADNLAEEVEQLKQRVAELERKISQGDKS